MTELAPGTEFSAYVIERLVGRGGFGAVYLARDTRLERRVALKVLEPHLASDPAARRRFIDESRIAASLDHPGIIPIHEAGEAEGRLFLAMRYVPGPDLGELIERDGALEPVRAGRIVSQVASALDAAHAAGLVHRDVKPGNVLLAPGTDASDHAYLTDFGLSKRVTGAGGVSQTRAGQFVGTVGYVAPEQVRGRTIDGRADTYSLGCLAYHVLTGHVPFERDSEVGTILAHTEEPPPSVHGSLPDVADRVDPVLAKAMAKDPAARYPSAGAFAADLAAGLSSRKPGAVLTRGFLFADLRGYSAFIEAHGDEAAVRLLDAFRRMVRLVVAREGGAEIKTEGDSFYVVFPSASAAVKAGLGIVAGAAAETAARPELPITVGVGVHAGESAAWVEGYVGSNVNIAARLCAQADPGEVLVSDTVRTLIRTSSHLGFDDRGTRNLKGIDEPMHVYAAQAEGTVPAAARPRSRTAAITGTRRGRLVALVGVLVVALVAVGAWLLVGGGDEPVAPAAAADGRLLVTNGLESNAFHVVDADGANGVEVFAEGGGIWSASWSPDGQRVAYAAEDGLWVSSTDGADRAQILSTADGAIDSVAWSPVSDELLITVWDIETDTPTFASVQADGTAYRELDLSTGGPGCPLPGATWATDGASIVFAGLDDASCGSAEPWSERLWIAAADGSDTRPLFASPLDEGELGAAWSPSGDRIAFVTASNPPDPQTFAIMLTDPAGRSVRELFRTEPGSGSGGLGSLTWSPDGTRLAFSGLDGRVWVLDVDSGELAPLGFDSQEFPDEPGVVMPYAVSWGPPGSGGPAGPVMPVAPSPTPEPTVAPGVEELEGLRDAGWIAGSIDEGVVGVGEIHLVSADGQRRSRVTIPEAGRGCCHWPQLSPDGAWLAFTDIAPDASEAPDPFRHPGELWVARRDGTEARRIIAVGVGGVLGSAAWSPDGTQLAVGYMRASWESDSGYTHTIVTIPADGGEPVEIAEPSPYETREPSWSADGRTITFQRADVADPTTSIWRIFEVDLEGGNERGLQLGIGSDATDPARSPVDDRLAFTGAEVAGTRTDVQIASGGGRTVTPITTDGQSRRPVWSPDGRWVAYSRDDGSSVVAAADGTASGMLPRISDGPFSGFEPSSWGPAAASSGTTGQLAAATRGAPLGRSVAIRRSRSTPPSRSVLGAAWTRPTTAESFTADLEAHPCIEVQRLERRQHRNALCRRGRVRSAVGVAVAPDHRRGLPPR